VCVRILAHFVRCIILLPVGCRAQLSGKKFMEYKVRVLIFRNVRKIAKSDYRVYVVCRKALIVSVCSVQEGTMSVRPPICNNSAPTGRIFMKFNI